MSETGVPESGSVDSSILDPTAEGVRGMRASEGCAADKDGITCGAESFQKHVMRYVHP